MNTIEENEVVVTKQVGAKKAKLSNEEKTQHAELEKAKKNAEKAETLRIEKERKEAEKAEKRRVEKERKDAEKAALKEEKEGKLYSPRALQLPENVIEDMKTIESFLKKVGLQLGKGRKEGVYQSAFCQELSRRQITNQKEETIPILYDGINIGYERIDIHIYNTGFTEMILELKAVDSDITSKNHWQVISYMRHLGCKFGAVINYNQSPSKSIQYDFVVIDSDDKAYVYDLKTGFTKTEPMNDYC